MSNKTTLQTNNNKLSANNTDLASILNTINSLPEAGSGGSGGGSVETGTLTLVANVNVGTGGYLKAYYTDEDMNIQTITINKGNAESITCVLNTPIVLEAQYRMSYPDYEFVLSGCDYINSSHEFAPYEIINSSTSTKTVFVLPIYLTSSSGSFTMKIYE